MADQIPLTAYTEEESRRYHAGRLRRGRASDFVAIVGRHVGLLTAATLASFENDFIGGRRGRGENPRAAGRRHAVFEPGPAELVEREAPAVAFGSVGAARGDPIGQGRLVGTLARESEDANLVAGNVRPVGSRRIPPGVVVVEKSTVRPDGAAFRQVLDFASRPGRGHRGGCRTPNSCARDRRWRTFHPDRILVGARSERGSIRCAGSTSR